MGFHSRYDAGPGWDAATGLGSPNGPALFALVTGGTSSPPPAPPPPSPPPVSPPPSPPPGQNLEAILQGIIDGVFAQLEQQYARHPIILRVLRQIQAAIDAELMQVFASSQSIAGDIITQIVQAAFAALEAQFSSVPFVSGILQALEPVVLQMILSLVGAQVKR